jgi:hypothetical protein
MQRESANRFPGGWPELVRQRVYSGCGKSIECGRRARANIIGSHMETKWTNKLLLGAVILVLGAGLGFLLRGLARPDSSDALQKRMSALESRLDAEQQATQQALQRIEQRVDSASLSAAVRNDLPALPPPPAVRAQQMQQQDTQNRLDLQKRFDSLTAAPRNDTVPQKVNDAFGNKDVLQAPELPLSENVDCRSTMCLITARFAPYQDGSDWGNRILMELADTLPNASVTSVPLPGGGIEMRIYAARAGERDPFGRASAQPR